jgi:hypothetical protein
MTKLLNPDAVKALFNEHDHQVDVALAIYKMVWPNWDDIESIDGWPSVTNETANKIMKWFIEFDKVHHPDVFAGGLWMNKGFSTSDSEWLIYFEVDDENVKLTYKDDAHG